MKRRSLLFAFLMYVFCMSAQVQSPQLEYHPFAEDDKTWEMQVGEIMENLYCNRIDGDTVINGENWKKVYNYIFPKLYYSYYAAIRDEGKKVYAIAKGSNRPRLLYDFGLKVGDLVRCGVDGNDFGCILEADEQPNPLLGFPFLTYLRVERIDTIKARGLEHRRFTLSLLDAFKERYGNGEESVINHVVWVEGVGSGAGPFSPWIPLPPRQSFFQACLIGKTCLFGYPDFYEADIADSVGSTLYEESEDHNSYDLSGRRLTAQPTRGGVYIMNGKNVVVK